MNIDERTELDTKLHLADDGGDTWCPSLQGCPTYNPCPTFCAEYGKYAQKCEQGSGVKQPDPVEVAQRARTRLSRHLCSL